MYEPFRVQQVIWVFLSIFPFVRWLVEKKILQEIFVSFYLALCTVQYSTYQTRYFKRWKHNDLFYKKSKKMVQKFKKYILFRLIEKVLISYWCWLTNGKLITDFYIYFLATFQTISKNKRVSIHCKYFSCNISGF